MMQTFKMQNKLLPKSGQKVLSNAMQAKSISPDVEAALGAAMKAQAFGFGISPKEPETYAQTKSRQSLEIPDHTIIEMLRKGPITAIDVEQETGIGRVRYRRWVARLSDSGVYNVAEGSVRIGHRNHKTNWITN